MKKFSSKTCFILSFALICNACSKNDSDDTGSEDASDVAVDTNDTEVSDTNDTDNHDADADDTNDTNGNDINDVDNSSCVETSVGEVPAEAEWITLDGVSSQLVALSDTILTSEAEGSEGIYDLNLAEAFGANGFYVDEPVQVVAVSARWTNLSEELEPVTIQLWNDLGADGFAFDVSAPLATSSRCINSENEEEWITHVFETPIEIEQYRFLYAGYHRDAASKEDGEYVYSSPELMFENHQNEEEPYFSGIRWPTFDPNYNYGGTITSWYTWQVRLAVIPMPEALASRDESAGPFQNDGVELGSRVAWGDYDNDGDDDLMASGLRLFENQNGSLVDVSETNLPEATRTSLTGGVWGDYNNDGCLDYFAQGRVDALLQGDCSGVFIDVILESGIHDRQNIRDCDGNGEEEDSPTEGAAWADVNGDGFLDLYLANYECRSEHDNYKNYQDILWINAGDGSFYNGSSEFEISSDFYAGRGVTTGDFDRDNDTDLFVSNYRLGPNFFYRNRRYQKFVNVAAENGTEGVLVSGAYGHTIGTAVGDIDNDGDFDLVSANLAHPFYLHFSDLTMVLINDGSGHFIDEADDRGIVYRETLSTPVLFDADNDGDLDLFITCIYESRYSDFYENDGTGHFTLRNAESELIVQNGWGAAAADVDNDGHVDMAATSLFRNEHESGNWLQVRAVGVGSNTSAIGATIEVETDALTQIRTVSGGSGTSSQDSMTQHFGLAESIAVERVTVYFPYQDPVVIENIEANARLWVYSDGRSGVSIAPPFPIGE